MNEHTSFRAQAPSVPAEFAEIATVCSATDVVIGGNAVLGIEDARSLHAGLSVGRDYSNWIKSRITKFGFQSGADYEVYRSPDLASAPRGGGQNALVYRVTLDMAKELAMVENNETGRMVRRYFIWLEKNAGHRPATAMRPHDFRNWSNEELRVRNATASLYLRVMNNPSAMWIMEELGFPMPPENLLPDWRQSEMWPNQPGSVTIHVAPQGRA